MSRSDPETESQPGGSRLRVELILGSVWLAVGLFLVPALIYLVGSSLLGPYGEKASMGTFYGAFFADLASGTARTWLLALGPLIIMSLARIFFIGMDRGNAPRSDGDDDEPAPRPALEPKPARKAPTASEPRRIEPRVGG